MQLNPLVNQQSIMTFPQTKEPCIRRMWTALENSRIMMIEGIAAAVAASHGLTMDDLKGPSRENAVKLARHEAMYKAKYYVPKAPVPLIGHVFNRDHTTVIYGISAHCARNALPGFEFSEKKQKYMREWHHGAA